MDIANKLFEKYYKKKCSLIIVIPTLILFGITMYYTIPSQQVKIIMIICLSVICVFYIIETVKYNSLPINMDGNSILVRIIAKNKDEYDDIKYKFGKEFENFVRKNNENLKILYIPYHLVDKYSYNENEKLIKLLQRTNCIFLTTIKMRSEDVSSSKQYITEFNIGIMHPTYIDKIEKIFQNEINILGGPVQRLEYSSKNKLSVLECTAKKISYVCKYIIGRAYFLSNELDGAQVLCDKLYDELEKINDEDLREIKKSVRTLGYDTHIAKMLTEDAKEDKKIDIIEAEIEAANKYIKGTYAYYEVKSVCCFLKDRDIKRTNVYIGNCKSLMKNGPWKYSVAFLKAYTGESEGKILYQYKQAFKVPYVHINLIDFIEEIIEKEPNKNMLRFALTLLYIKVGNIDSAKSVFCEYLENKDSHKVDEATSNQIIKLFEKEYEKEILEGIIKNEKEL